MVAMFVLESPSGPIPQAGLCGACVNVMELVSLATDRERSRTPKDRLLAVPIVLDTNTLGFVAGAFHVRARNEWASHLVPLMASRNSLWQRVKGVMWFFLMPAYYKVPPFLEVLMLFHGRSALHIELNLQVC